MVSALALALLRWPRVGSRALPTVELCRALCRFEGKYYWYPYWYAYCR